MNKKIIIFIILLIAVVTVIVSSIVIYGEGTREMVTGIMSKITKEEDIESSNAEVEITNYLDSKGVAKNEQGDVVLYYDFYTQMQGATDKDKKELNKLIKKGYDPFRILEIYELLIDTEPDYKLIEKIYLLGKKTGFDTKDWAENAYNAVTEQKNGVLSMDEIKAYYERGLTRDDILVANVLSRTGRQTITEILDKRADGTLWAEIFNICKNSKYDFPETDDPVEILLSYRMAKINGESPAAFAKKNKGNIKRKYMDEKNAKYEHSKERVIKAGLSLSDREEN